MSDEQVETPDGRIGLFGDQNHINPEYDTGSTPGEMHADVAEPEPESDEERRERIVRGSFVGDLEDVRLATDLDELPHDGAATAAWVNGRMLAHDLRPVETLRGKAV